MQGDYAEAIPDFDAVLALDPDNAEALGSRGLASSGLGNHEEAISDLAGPWPSSPTTWLP